MSDTTFYITAIVCVILAVIVLKHVVSCLIRLLVVAALAIGLALTYYFFVGQYDPEMHDAVEKAKQEYGTKHSDTTPDTKDCDTPKRRNK